MRFVAFGAAVANVDALRRFISARDLRKLAEITNAAAPFFFGAQSTSTTMRALFAPSQLRELCAFDTPGILI
jgi:hypothetical protein